MAKKSKIPGLNEQLYKQLVSQYSDTGNTRSQAELSYRAARGIVNPLQQKLMWPSIIGGMLDPSMFGPRIASMVGKISPEMGKSLTGPLGQVAGASSLAPRILADITRTSRMPYERQFRSQLGKTGKVASMYDMFSLLNSPLSTTRYALRTAGNYDTARLIPRLENLLTGTTTQVMKGGGYGAAEGGGILTGAYQGAKGVGKTLAAKSGLTELATDLTKKAGISGAAGTGLGLLDKGITGLLSSPTGLSMGIAAVGIVASIRKSMKLAKLMPSRTPSDKFARKFYSPGSTSTAMTSIMNMGKAGRMDPATMTMMLTQLQVVEAQKMNMQLAGFRGEYRSESEFNREEREKSTGEASVDSYETDILGKDKRSMSDKIFDKLEYSLLSAKEKFDPIGQISRTIIDAISGKGFTTPGGRLAELKKAYGYDVDRKEEEKLSADIGVPVSQSRLMQVSVTEAINSAATYDSKMLRLSMMGVGLQQIIASELLTIRTGGFNLDKNQFYRKESSPFIQTLKGIVDKINPLNLPGINALWNITKGVGKFATQTLPGIPNKIYAMGKKALTGTRDAILGEGYSKLRDKDEWARAAGLDIPAQQKAYEFMGNGLPDQVERIRSVLFDIYYVQEEMLRQMGGEVSKKDERLIWSVKERRYLDQEATKVMEKSQKLALLAVKEHAFRAGPLGKLLYLADLMTTKVGSGFMKKWEGKQSVARSMRRMTKTEDLASKIEIAISGEPETFKSNRALSEILAEISSIKTTKAMPYTSIAELESERRLERAPTDIKWKLAAGGSGLVALLAPLLGPIGLVTSSASIVAFLKALQEREKLIIEEREREIENRNIIERGVETQEIYFNKSVKERIKEMERQREFIGPLTRTKADITNDKIDMSNEYLAKIQSYLGDERGSVYELLEPGRRVAEVTIVDKDAKPLFPIEPLFPNTPSVEQLAPVINIQDYYQQEFSQAAAKGGLIDRGKPVLVGEEGPEILMPGKPGLVIPNDAIQGYAPGGILGKTPGDYGIFSEMTGYIKELVTINWDGLKLDIDQANKDKKDNLHQTMQEKLDELNQREEAKKDSIWKKDVIELLTGIFKKPTSEKKKEKEKSKSLWDFLMGLDWGSLAKKLLVGLGLAGLGAAIWALIDKIGPMIDKLKDISNWLEANGMSVVEQLKLIGRGVIGAGLVVGSVTTGGFAKSKDFLKGITTRTPKVPSVVPETSPVVEGTKTIKQTTAPEKYQPKSLKDIVAEGKRLREIEQRVGKGTTPKELGKIISQRREARLAEEASRSPWGKIKGLGKGFVQETKIIGKSIGESGPAQLGKAIGKFGQEGLKSAGEGILKGATSVGEKFTGIRGALADSKLGKAGTWITDKGSKVIESGLKGFESIAKVFSKIQSSKVIEVFGKTMKWVGSAFEPLLTPLKFLGRILGKIALPLQIITTIFDFASDAIEGYKEGGLMGGVKGFLIGPMKDNMETTLGQVGKYFGLGMMLGMPGGPLGMLVGGFAGAIVGALISAVKSAFMAYDADGMGGFIKQLFAGDKEGGLLSAIKTAGPYAAMGAVAGTVVFPGIGTLIGGIVGAGIGGLIGWVGQWGLADIATNLGDSFANFITSSNNAIVNLFTGPGQKYAEEGAVQGSKLAFGIGPLIGGILGSIVDLFVNIGQFAGRVVHNLWIWAKNKGRSIPVIGGLIGGKEEAYETGVDEFAEDKKRAEASKSARDKGLSNQIKVQEAEKVATTQSRTKELEVKQLKKRQVSPVVPATPAGSVGGTPPPTEVAVKTTPAPSDTSADVPTPPGSIAQILQGASAATGAPLGIMQKIAYSESKFDPKADASKNPPGSRSSAAGLFQFIKETWDSMIKSKGKKHGLSSDTSPFDARANALMGGEYISDNMKAIQSSVLSSPPNAADVYMAHFMGTGGAKQFFRELKKNPDKTAFDAFPKAAAANATIFYKDGDKSKPRTFREVYSLMAQKMSVDPGPSLAKAGTGRTTGEKGEELLYKAGEKAKDIFGILTGAFEKIKNAFIDAFTKSFDDSGLKKSPGVKPIEKGPVSDAAQRTSETNAKALADQKLKDDEENKKPCKAAGEFIQKRIKIILADKKFQDYYGTHLIATSDDKGVKLSKDDIESAAVQIAANEWDNGVNVPGVNYKFNPATAPFNDLLYDSTMGGSGKDYLKKYDETNENIRTRAEKEASKAESKKEETKGGVPTNNGVVDALGGSSPISEVVSTSGKGEKVADQTVDYFNKLSDPEKAIYLDMMYNDEHKPIPHVFRKEAKRLGKLTAEKDIIGAVGPKAGPVSDADKQIAEENAKRVKEGRESLTPTQEMMVRKGLVVGDTRESGRSEGAKWVDTDKVGGGSWVSQEEIATADKAKYKGREHQIFNKFGKAGELKKMKLAGPGWKGSASKKDIAKYDKEFYAGGFTSQVTGSEMSDILKSKDPSLKYAYDTAENAGFGISAEDLKGIGKPISDPGAINMAMKEGPSTPEVADESKKLNAEPMRKRAEMLTAMARDRKVGTKVGKPMLKGPSPQSAPVERGQYGTEISKTFSQLEQSIFGSIDGALIGATANYPFGAKIQHSATT